MTTFTKLPTKVKASIELLEEWGYDTTLESNEATHGTFWWITGECDKGGNKLNNSIATIGWFTKAGGRRTTRFSSARISGIMDDTGKLENMQEFRDGVRHHGKLIAAAFGKDTE